MSSKPPVGSAMRPAHHRPGGGFRNPPGSPRQGATLRDFLKFLLIDMRRAKLPRVPPEMKSATPPDLAGMPDDSVAWLGHASFAVRLGGKLIVTDPFLGKTAGPFGLGPKRFLAPALTAAELPRADLIVISHNHYDHLDSTALRAYRFRAETPVIVPLGLAPMLRRLGFAQATELDWWDEWQDGPLSVTALPAVHFSGRGLFDRNRTLWASFALAVGGKRVWFGGDTAPGPVFEEIGASQGPFDLALVGIGAYEPVAIMRASHATPEEAVGIARAIGARRAVGMHWGSIMLTPEDPFEAPGRFRRAALEQQYGEDNAWILQVGEIRGF